VSETSCANASVTLENAYAVGVTYVTTSGDSTLTVGAGYHDATNNSQSATTDNAVYHVGATVETGDLTVGAGFMDGDWVAENNQMQGSFASVGAKYVSGDITFNVGLTSGDAKDEALGTNATGSEDSVDVVGASVDYAIASGVTGTVGYRNQDSEDDGSSANTFSGSSWYVGATVSF
jgi:hypothetical protein